MREVKSTGNKTGRSDNGQRRWQWRRKTERYVKMERKWCERCDVVEKRFIKVRKL